MARSDPHRHGAPGRGARVAAFLAAALAACAGAPVAPPAPASKAATWPDDWSIRFALRCRSMGEEVRVCVCLANEIQRRWTPEEFREREPDALAGELERCRTLVAE